MNCDNIFTLPKTMLTKRRGSLGPVALDAFNSALEIALGLGN
jgi:mRNA-degrading endonuclease toxin of MazEF toxin-antitoxin module